MGRISDRIGRKRAMVIGVAVSMAAMALEVTLTNPTLILAAAFVNGTAGALYFLSQAPFMMKASDSENRTLLFSLNFGLITLSGAFGSLFAGQLPAFFGGVLGVTASSASAYQAVLLASVFLSVFTLVPLLLIKESKSDESKVIKPEKGVSLREVLRNPMTLKLSLPGLLIGSGAALLIPYLNLFFADKFQVSDETLGVLFSISALMTGVGSIIGPRLETGLGSKIRAVVFTQAGSLAFLLLMGFSPYMGLAVVGFLMRGTLMNMAMPLFSAFAMEQVAEREQATVNSIKELTWQMGWLVGPVISGIVQERYGFSPLFAATGVLYGLSCLATWVLFHKREAADVDVTFDGDLAPVVLESTGD